MRNIILAILILCSLGAFAQRESKVSDSTRFTKGVRFDSTLVFKRLKAAAVKDTVLVIMDANGTVSKINKSNLLSVISGGGSQTLSISGDTLSISDGNSVVLPVYVQADSSTISSYDVLNSQNAPPGSPAIGDTYLVGNSPSGAWAGHSKDIAEWNGSAWVFTDGVQGDFLYNATTALTYIFRSGNWVQTTGAPALNNGNNISGGLKIGTNNARSLTFETNNVNRGRFDSIGRFHVYNIPTATDTFITTINSDGLFTKTGKTSIVDTNILSTKANVTGLLLTKQDNLVSGTNIKTINSNSLLGSGNIVTPDAQTLTAGVNTLTISGGNTVNLNRKVDTSYQIKNTTRDSTCQITIINGIAYRSCTKDTVSTLTATSTTTFTNKRITARIDSTTSSATPTINTDNVDTYKLTAQAADITSFTTNLSGTPSDDQILHIVIIGTASRAITWGSAFESSTVALPTTTVGTNRLDVYFIRNTATSKWRCGGVW